jgi:hypothetical protein
MATNLLECFNEEHPAYPHSKDHDASTAADMSKASSTTTAEQQLPKLFIKRSHVTYIDIAEKYLRSNRAKNHPMFKTGTIASPEEAKAVLRNEAVVVMVAMAYLLDPVKKAINAKYKTPITRDAEVKMEKCRLDFSFNINQDDPDKDTQPIVVVEFKRKGLLRWNDFDQASVDDDPDDIKERLQEMRDEKPQRTTSFENPKCSGWWCAKQATVYAVNFKCPFVALCDYETLILLYFDNQLETVRVTHVPRNLFRKALLGFTIEACDRAGLS